MKTSPLVVAHSHPYNYWHDFYQAYYWAAIRAHLESKGGKLCLTSKSRCPAVLRGLRKLRDSYRLEALLGRKTRLFSWLDGFARWMGEISPDEDQMFPPAVGRYVFHLPDGTVAQVCIDAADKGEIEGSLLDSCDLYFKANYWPANQYPAKVSPLVVGNPGVLRNIKQLRAMRSAVKEYDLCFIVRVWGGTHAEQGVEHILRMLEQISRVPCRKYLLAYLVVGDIPSYVRRLEKAGIPWTTRPLGHQELWRVSARSTLNVIRLGMHYCMPWRMVDMLAMGACVVLDRAPHTVWPAPLAEGRHFLKLNLEVSPDQPLAGTEQYAAIPGRIQRWLEEPGLAARVSAESGAYFDAHVAEERLGEYIFNRVAAQTTGRS